MSDRIAVLNDEVEVYNAGAYYVGVSKYTENPAETRQVLKGLQGQQPFVAMNQSDGAIEYRSGRRTLRTPRLSSTG